MRFELLSKVGRPTMAVGTWILLTLLMGLVPPDISIWSAFALLVPISVSSAISLLLISEDWLNGSQRRLWARSVLTGVSLAVPIGWAVWLGSNSSSAMSPILFLFSVFPVLVAIQVIGKTCGPRDQKESKVSDELSVTEDHTLIPPKLAEIIPERDEQELVTLGIVAEQESSVPAEFTQWLTRSLTQEGEVIEGGVRVDFQQGQRDATVHVSFCPPLDCVPEVVTEDLDGADLEIRVAATFKFGTRLTVRRNQASYSRGEKFPASSCKIGFVAVASASRRVA